MGLLGWLLLLRLLLLLLGPLLLLLWLLLLLLPLLGPLLLLQLLPGLLLGVSRGPLPVLLLWRLWSGPLRTRGGPG
jgi:hypothetical protein